MSRYFVLPLIPIVVATSSARAGDRRQLLDGSAASDFGDPVLFKISPPPPAKAGTWLDDRILTR